MEWNKLIQREKLIMKMFFECGILINKTGSDKDWIHIPGINDYSYVV